MKIMKLLASCAMVGALTAVCASGAFADAAVTATYTAADAEAETGAKVTVAVTDYAVTGDYTVLVLNADVDAESRGENAGKVTNADITQIDQWNGTTTIELALPDDIADGTYYVRVGGAESGYISTTFEVADPEAGNDVEVTVDNTTADAFGTTGSSAVIVTATSEIPTGKAVAYDGTPMYYTEYTVDGKTVVKYVALCANFDAEKIALVDGANTRIGYGNLAGTTDFTINSLDLNEMLTIVLDNSKANTDLIKLTADVNADGKTNSMDLNEVLSMVLDSLYVPSAAKK